MLVTGIIGYPLDVTYSPFLHRRAFRALGIEGVYLTLAIREEELRTAVDALPSLGMSGCNVTIPYKQRILSHIDEVHEEAGKVGAVNTILFEEGRVIGHNTDTFGFRRSLEMKDFKVQGKRILLFGAGGAGAACAYVISMLKPARFMITDIRDDRAEQLSERYGAEYLYTEMSHGMVAQMDLVINATSVDLQHTVLPLMRDGSSYYDINYRFGHLHAGGVRTMDGRLMLALQAAQSFHLWTGCEPPVEVMMDALEETCEMVNGR